MWYLALLQAGFDCLSGVCLLRDVGVPASGAWHMHYGLCRGLFRLYYRLRCTFVIYEWLLYFSAQPLLRLSSALLFSVYKSLKGEGTVQAKMEDVLIVPHVQHSSNAVTCSALLANDLDERRSRYG